MQELVTYLTDLSTQQHDPYQANWDVLLLLPMFVVLAILFYELFTWDREELFRR